MTDQDNGNQLLSRGSYSLYRTQAGGLHLAYRDEDTDTDRHIPLPPALVRMAESAANGGGPLARLRAVFGGVPGIEE